MGHLNALTITALKARVAMTPQEQRRAKLIAKLEEQRALADAQATGQAHVVMKNAWTRDGNGNRIRVEREKRIKAWWWKDGGSVTLVVRYGAKPIDLAKGGKKAISLPDIAAVPATLGTVIEAVRAGELDAAIDAVVTASKAKQGSKA